MIHFEENERNPPQGGQVQATTPGILGQLQRQITGTGGGRGSMMDMLVDARGDGGSGINAAWFLIFDAAIQLES